MKKRFTKYKVVEADNPPTPVGNLSVLTGKLLVGCRNPQSDSLQADFILILEMITRSYFMLLKNLPALKLKDVDTPPPFLEKLRKIVRFGKGCLPFAELPPAE